MDTPFSTQIDRPVDTLVISVRTSDGQTTEVHGSTQVPLRAVLQEVSGKLHFQLAGNQIAYFSFNGTRYDIEGKRLGDIVGLKTGDQIALLIETRSG